MPPQPAEDDRSRSRDRVRLRHRWTDAGSSASGGRRVEAAFGPADPSFGRAGLGVYSLRGVSQTTQVSPDPSLTTGVQFTRALLVALALETAAVLVAHPIVTCLLTLKMSDRPFAARWYPYLQPPLPDVRRPTPLVGNASRTPVDANRFFLQPDIYDSWRYRCELCTLTIGR